MYNTEKFETILFNKIEMTAKGGLKFVWESHNNRENSITIEKTVKMSCLQKIIFKLYLKRCRNNGRVINGSFRK